MRGVPLERLEELRSYAASPASSSGSLELPDTGVTPESHSRQFERELGSEVTSEVRALSNRALGGIPRGRLFIDFDQNFAGVMLARALQNPEGDSMTADDPILSDPEQFHNSLSEFGIELQRVVRGRDVIDLGCGYRGEQPTPEFARLMGASRYIGVDLKTESDVARKRAEQQQDFPTIYRQDEMLVFLARLNPAEETDQGRVFVLSGIESMHVDLREVDRVEELDRQGRSNEVTAAERRKHEASEHLVGYHDKLYELLDRATSSGDAVLFGPRSEGLNFERLEKLGFKQSTDQPLYVKL